MPKLSDEAVADLCTIESPHEILEVAEDQLQLTEDEKMGSLEGVSGSILSLISGKLNDAETKPVKATKPRKPKDDNQNADTNSGGESSSSGTGASGRGNQRKRSTKKVDDNRLYDGTQLHASHHGYFVHRDYAGHFFRWGFASRIIKPGMRIMDVGCGQDVALARVISAPNVYKNCAPSEVVCVDWNPLGENFNPSWLTKVPEFDFCTRWPQLIGSYLPDNRFVELPDKKFDLITCLEVIEHMDIIQGDQLLAGILGCLKQDGMLLLSTPVFNGSAAANHIHEYGIQELWNKLDAAGFELVARYGTFANLTDLKKVMSEAELELMSWLSQYYSNDVLSCFFAPKYPDASRNNIWLLKKKMVWTDVPPIPGVPAIPAVPMIPDDAISKAIAESGEPYRGVIHAQPPVPSTGFIHPANSMLEDDDINVEEAHQHLLDSEE